MGTTINHIPQKQQLNLTEPKNKVKLGKGKVRRLFWIDQENFE